ncbi:MAG: CPBP family intramembrane glutamic endopeptidase [Caldilineaceae bacterium]
MGWRLNLRGNGRSYLLGTLALPLTMLAVLGIGLATGLAALNADATLADYVVAVIPMAIIYLVFGLFEEVGWRGYLVPRVAGWNDGLLGHVLVGVIWASWHFPYMAELWGHTDESLLTLLPRFVLGTIVFAVFYGEIRLRTGSVWPAVIMHWLGNTVANSLLSGFNGEGFINLSPGTIWLTSPGVEGTLMIVVFAVLGGLLYTSRKRSRHVPAVAQASMITQ